MLKHCLNRDDIGMAKLVQDLELLLYRDSSGTRQIVCLEEALATIDGREVHFVAVALLDRGDVVVVVNPDIIAAQKFHIS